MRSPKHSVELSQEEQGQLEKLLHKGKSSPRQQTRARILLKANEGMSVQEIVIALDTSENVVYRVRHRFIQEGLESALNEKPRPGQKSKVNTQQCAYLIALADSEAPEGRHRWTLRLLADQVVELGFADAISHETIRKIINKKLSKPIRKQTRKHSASQC